MQMFEIVSYVKEDGSTPMQDFIMNLDRKMKAKIFREISFLAANGNLLREPHSKLLGDGIFELRAQVGTDISRVLYFFVIGRKAVLTHGFIKKTQETPPEEIERAKRYRADYYKRKGKEHGRN